MRPGVSLLLGAPGCGKSTRFRALLRRARELWVWDVNDEHRILGPWDYEGEVRGWLRAQAGQPDRLKRVRLWGGLADFELACRWWLAVGGPGMLGLDELHAVAPTTGDRGHPFRELVLRHRHLRWRIVAVGWRPAEVPRYLTAGDPDVWIGRLEQDLDLDWIRRTWGLELAARVPTLRVGSFVHHHPGLRPNRKS